MLKYQLDTLDGLDESQHSFYEEKDGKFVLKVDGVPQQEDVSGLKAKLDELLGEKKEAKRKAEEAEAERKRLAEEAARKNGDVAALEESWNTKYTTREKELLAELDQYKSQIHGLTVGQTATQVAAKLAITGSDKVLLPHVKSRLYLKDNGEVGVLDLQGKPSAATIAEFEAELANDPAFKPLIVANLASGSGATNNGGSGGAAKKPSEYTEAERVALKRENPDLFKQIFS